MDVKQQIIMYVNEIGSLRSQVSQHWSWAEKSIQAGHVEDAIPLLNRYFHLKEQLEGAESRLASALRGTFSDR